MRILPLIGTMALLGIGCLKSSKEEPFNEEKKSCLLQELSRYMSGSPAVLNIWSQKKGDQWEIHVEGLKSDHLTCESKSFCKIAGSGIADTFLIRDSDHYVFSSRSDEEVEDVFFSESLSPNSYSEDVIHKKMQMAKAQGAEITQSEIIQPPERREFSINGKKLYRVGRVNLHSHGNQNSRKTEYACFRFDPPSLISAVQNQNPNHPDFANVFEGSICSVSKAGVVESRYKRAVENCLGLRFDK